MIGSSASLVPRNAAHPKGLSAPHSMLSNLRISEVSAHCRRRRAGGAAKRAVNPAPADLTAPIRSIRAVQGLCFLLRERSDADYAPNIADGLMTRFILAGASGI